MAHSQIDSKTTHPQLAQWIAETLQTDVATLDKVDGKEDGILKPLHIYASDEFNDRIVKAGRNGGCAEAWFIDNGDKVVGDGDLFLHADGHYSLRGAKGKAVPGFRFVHLFKKPKTTDQTPEKARTNPALTGDVLEIKKQAEKMRGKPFKDLAKTVWRLPQCGRPPFLLGQNQYLFHYARYGGMEGLKEAIAKGADINVISSSGHNALMLAARRNDYEMAKFLLDKGADVNGKTEWGMSPLMAAAYFADLPLVKLYLEHGADLFAETKAGSTAISLANGSKLAVWNYLCDKAREAGVNHHHCRRSFVGELRTITVGDDGTVSVLAHPPAGILVEVPGY